MKLNLTRSEVCLVMRALTFAQETVEHELDEIDDRPVAPDPEDNYIYHLLTTRQMWKDLHDGVKRQLDMYDEQRGVKA